LCRRTNQERLEISKAYQEKYERELVKDLKSETSGKFRKILVNLMKPMAQYCAEQLRAAMKGLGTDEELLIEILCSLPTREIKAIAAAYQENYKKTLEEALKKETSNYFKKLLVSLTTGQRDETNITNILTAQEDAQRLKKAGVGQMGTDEGEFYRILSARNFSQLALIAREYEKLVGNSLEHDIKKEFSGDIKDALTSIVRCATDPGAFFAKKINKAIAGLGTDDTSLQRLVILLVILCDF
jgi:annexin A7/11